MAADTIAGAGMAAIAGITTATGDGEMAIRLGEEVIRKIKDDFPAMNINQIASKYGVGWGTVRDIVQPAQPKNKQTNKQTNGGRAECRTRMGSVCRLRMNWRMPGGIRFPWKRRLSC